MRTAPLTNCLVPWSVSVVSSSSVVDLTDVGEAGLGLLAFSPRKKRRLLRNVLRALRRNESRNSLVSSAGLSRDEPLESDDDDDDELLDVPVSMLWLLELDVDAASLSFDPDGEQ